jgi:hypothetical protein
VTETPVDWNPDDPDQPRVFYDLSGWTFDQQAELAAQLADTEVPHSWDGSELVVPEQAEQAADLAIAEVEMRLGIESSDDGTVNRPAVADDDEDDMSVVHLELGHDVPSTEYDLADWGRLDHLTAARALADAGIAFRWEGSTLLVATTDEDRVEPLLDGVEVTGEDGDTAERLPFETLTTFFLAGERLKRNPLDANGLEELLAALDVADPVSPPYGVEPALWRRTCELAEELADALAEDDEPDERDALEIAEELHDLLRPFV